MFILRERTHVGINHYLKSACLYFQVRLSRATSPQQERGYILRKYYSWIEILKDQERHWIVVSDEFNDTLKKEGINVQLTIHITTLKVITDEQYQTFLLLEEPQSSTVNWTHSKYWKEAKIGFPIRHCDLRNFTGDCFLVSRLLKSEIVCWSGRVICLLTTLP